MKDEPVGTIKIEVDFPEPVKFPAGWEQRFVAMISEVTRLYEREHPDRVMWPAGMGGKPNFDYTGFDMETYHIGVAERENFDWPCKKCHYSQGNHAHVLWGAPAENCDYEPADKPYLDWKGFYRRMVTPGSYRSKIKRKARMRRFKSSITGRRYFRAYS